MTYFYFCYEWRSLYTIRAKCILLLLYLFQEMEMEVVDFVVAYCLPLGNFSIYFADDRSLP